MKLKIAKSQLLLNQLRWCFKVHSSIDPMESGKLTLVNYFWQIQDGDIQDGVPLLSCVHAPLFPCSCMYVYIYSPDMDIQKYAVTMEIIVNSVKISSPIGTISNSEVVDLQ